MRQRTLGNVHAGNRDTRALQSVRHIAPGRSQDPTELHNPRAGAARRSNRQTYPQSPAGGWPPQTGDPDGPGAFPWKCAYRPKRGRWSFDKAAAFPAAPANPDAPCFLLPANSKRLGFRDLRPAGPFFSVLRPCATRFGRSKRLYGDQDDAQGVDHRLGARFVDKVGGHHDRPAVDFRYEVTASIG